MSVLKQELAEGVSGQSSRQVVVAWFAITVGVALLFGLSKTESPAHAEPAELHQVSVPGVTKGSQWIRRLPAGTAGLSNGVAKFEFINHTEEPVSRIEIVVRETDSLNRLVRDHREAADSLAAGQGWVFEVRPLQTNSVLAVTEMKMR